MQYGGLFIAYKTANKFARNLLILRTQNGWSQQELAEKISVTRQTISTWERGLGNPDIYIFSDICELFGISADVMLFENVLDAPTEIIQESVVYVEHCDTEDIDYISSIHSKGYYTIIDEDLENFFGIIAYDFTKIMVIALALHKQGYIVTEVFYNGFSVVLSSEENVENFSRNLFDILDAFIHHDDDFIEQKTITLSEDIDRVKNECIDEVMAELHGGNIYDYAYYWVDAEQNPRGYANSEEECEIQAAQQGCVEFTILKMA